MTMNNLDPSDRALRKEPEAAVRDQGAPRRVQLSRAKGWRMPSNTVKVDRTTPWGNPCIVGTHGTREECVRWFDLAMAEVFVMGHKVNEDGTWLASQLIAYRKKFNQNRHFLRGKNLACWCPLDKPCHADVLLRLANSELCKAASGCSHTAEPNEQEGTA